MKFNIYYVRILWTKEETKILIKLYPTTIIKKLSKVLNKSEYSVTAKIARLKLKKKKWNEEQTNKLIELYPTTSVKKLSKIFNKSEGAITAKVFKLKLKNKRLSAWSADQINKLIKLYTTTTIKKLSKILNKSEISIFGKAYNLNLKKKQSKTWTNEQIEILKKLFHTTSINKISKIINRQRSSILKKTKELNLTKQIITEEELYNMVLQTAKKYKSKSLFTKGSPKEYSLARRKKWLDLVCSHMIPGRYSLPQLILKEMTSILLNSTPLYDDRKTICPLELDIYYPEFSLAFEYGDLMWHKPGSDSAKRDKIKKVVCKEKQIYLFTVLGDARNENYYMLFKTFLIKNIIKLNKITGKNITIEKINNIEINKNNLLLDASDIKNITDKYTSYTKFEKEQRKIFNRLYRLDLLEEYTKHMERRTLWNDAKAIEEINKYEYLKDFERNSGGCYGYLKDNNKKHFTNALKREFRWTDVKIIEEVNKYEYLKDFIKNSKNCYQYIQRKKKWVFLSKLKR